MMDNVEAHERLTRVETQIEHLQEALKGIQASLDELKPIVWRAAGAAVAVLAAVEFLVKVLR